MADLRPYPFTALVRRALRELEERNSVFDLPIDKGKLALYCLGSFVAAAAVSLLFLL